jgi:malonyl-CoA/methylmalonyl-CoA synthetase
VAVPLSASQAPAEWEYIVRDVEPAFVVGPDEPGTLADISARHGSVFVRSRDDPARDRASDAAGGAEDVRLPAVESGSAALVLYTSGTTSRPKGVVLTHANLAAQMSALAGAWGWRPDDRVLHVLPLNHVHGIVNVLGCALWSGACCEFLPFEANAVWERFAAGGPTLFMAVPTVYTKLLAAFEAAPPATRVRWSAGAGRLRLMVSGSAALPVTLLARWREATGHVLLERYGMTEIGMALSNPLDGPRRAGSVGTPLPGVEVRLVDEHGKAVPDGGAGEIEVRGPAVFREYWRRPDATREAFRDGWFRTGDVARVEDGAYRILGRSSVDIIKTGGYKVSALEVEEVLREHPGVADAAVVGVPDEEWGERVAAAIVPREGAAASLPRNAMGKVVKTEVRRMFQDP